MKIKCFFAVSILLMFFSTQVVAENCVVLLHGLARSASSMSKLEQALVDEGYQVFNKGYPSRSDVIPVLAEQAVTEGLSWCQSLENPQINFVTHSLGGILVRYYLDEHPETAVNKVVMLGPPNHGSEVVDKLRNMPGYKLFNGPAGLQLGTDADSIPAQLGPLNFEAGIIAGTRSINLLLSRYLPNPDDGKVSVASARVAGMCSLLLVPVSHPMLMRNNEVITQVLNFLESGRFNSVNAENDLCL